MFSERFMILMNKDSIMTWQRALDLYSLARKNKTFSRFGYGIKVPISGFPDLVKLAEKYKMKDYFFVLYTTPRSREVPIHVDGIPNSLNAASINWPLENCDELSPTEWFHVDAPIHKTIDGSYFLANTQDARSIHRESMLSSFRAPYLFRSDIWHRGYNQSQSTRVILKWELERGSWESTVSEFSSLGLLAMS